MKILEKILSKDKKSKFPVTKNLNIEIDIQKESILPYGSSVILKKYPAIGGIISSSIFHSKDKKQMYFIHINGKSKTKRYIKDDFILDLKGSWGYYPWFPEDGDHFISPCDLENFKNINPVKVDKTTIINLEKGKLPPQVLDLEEAVLGAMMIDKKGVDDVIDILQPDAFYK